MKAVLLVCLLVVFCIVLSESIRPNYVNKHKSLNFATFDNIQGQRNIVNSLINCEQCQKLEKKAANYQSCLDLAENDLSISSFYAQVVCSYLGDHVTDKDICSSIFDNCSSNN